MHPGLFLLAITFNSIPPLCWEAELMHIRWADSCYSSSCLSIACARECCWFMFSQVPHFFMPGKLPDETHQMLCALKLSQRDKTPKTTIRPRQVPRVTCQSLHLQHKSSEVCFWGFIVHLFMLNKTGGGFLINISKNTPGNQHRGGLRYVYLNLNNKKADDTQKELFLLLEEISQHLRGKMSTAPVPEKKWGKVCEEKSFLVTAVGDRRACSFVGCWRGDPWCETQGETLLWQPSIATTRSPVQGLGTSPSPTTHSRLRESCRVSALTKHQFLFIGHEGRQAEHFTWRCLYRRKRPLVRGLPPTRSRLCHSIWQHGPTLWSEDYH